MTDEEVNKKFDVVADFLASLATGQQKADERIVRLERVLMLAIRAGQRERKDTREKFNTLAEAMSKMAEAHSKMAEAQNAHRPATRRLN
ncbi:MAG: hypothetical protein WKF84_11730 [Pyrinomonadaceae bacterium]